jgi:hypothetical protein
MRIFRIFQATFLLAGLLAPGCAGHTAPPSDVERPAPPVTLSGEAERSVCLQLRNDSGTRVELHSLLASKIRNKKYQVTQDCGSAGYVLSIHVLEIRRGDNAEDPVFEDDWGAPVLGLGVGSGMGGRGGVRVGAGLGLAFPLGTRQLSPAPGYSYTMIVELEIEESTQGTRVRQQTQLRVTTPAPSEAAALPRLEEQTAEAIRAILP